jgi:arylformamidase
VAARIDTKAAFFNREYNNRELVPEFAEIFARWTETSLAARSRLKAHLDVAYGSTPKQTLDVFPAMHAPTHGAARTRTQPPILMFIHGGYWRSLDKSDVSYLATPWVKSGVTFVAVNYDLAPAVTMEEIVRQNLMAVTWLFLHAGQFGADPHRIYVAGHSAGGHLTAMLMAALFPRWHGTLPPDVVKGGIAVSGLYDIDAVRRAPFLNASLTLTPERADTLSPHLMPPATHAPLITAVGGDESSEFHRQNRLIGSAWKNVLHADVPCPNRNHFTVCDALGEPDHALFKATFDLIHLAYS